MGYQLASDPRMSELIRRVISGSTAGASSEAGVSEPAGGPPSRDLDPLETIPEAYEPAPSPEEPARKVQRIEEPPGVRAPGTPTEYMLRALQNAGRAPVSPSSSSSLTPAEDLTGEHRVGRQVREWEEVTN